MSFSTCDYEQAVPVVLKSNHFKRRMVLTVTKFVTIRYFYGVTLKAMPTSVTYAVCIKWK
jgi:multidrug transporter EmrE-like cation transporter